MNEPIMPRVVAELEAAVDGIHSSTIIYRLKCRPQTVLDLLRKLKQQGKADSVSDPDAMAVRRRLWCLPERVAHCQSIVAARKASKHCTNSKAIGDWPGTAKPMVLGPAARVHVAEPEKFFGRAGYRPDMLHTGSAIARAYGERAA